MHEKCFQMHSCPHASAMHATVFGPGLSMAFLIYHERPLLRDGPFLYIHSASCLTAHMSMQDTQVAPLSVSLGKNSEISLRRLFRLFTHMLVESAQMRVT